PLRPLPGRWRPRRRRVGPAGHRHVPGALNPLPPLCFGCSCRHYVRTSAPRTGGGAMKDLSGKTAVVTGSGSGIGRGTALALADAGMSVVVADIDEAAAQAVAKEVGERGVRGVAVKVDVADRASVEQLAEAAYNEFGEVHALHNNAGVG